MRKIDKQKNINKINELFQKRCLMDKGLIIEEHGDGKIGTALRPLLDGMIGSEIRKIDLNNYNERNDLITKIENVLNSGDWISLSDGTTFTKTFTPKGR